MHIPDGLIDAPAVLIGSYAVTGGVTWYSLHKISQQKNPQAKIPKASLLTAAFFVVNLIHIPLPPASIHLVLNGMMGVILGYYAFPAILIGLFFQAVMFQHGGLSTLGLNAIIMGIPALLAYGIFQLRYWTRIQESTQLKLFAFLAGTGGVMIAAVIFAIVVITTITGDIDAEMERKAVYFGLAAYSIPAVVEGFFTMMLVAFLSRVKPELLENNE
ncbi:MAG: cobalt transporter CbiM [Chroococcales cyanobacterium]